MDCGLPGSSVHWLFPARVLELVAIAFSRGSSQPRNQTRVSHIAGKFFTLLATSEAHKNQHNNIHWYICSVLLNYHCIRKSYKNTGWMKIHLIFYQTYKTNGTGIHILVYNNLYTIGLKICMAIPISLTMFIYHLPNT